MRVLVACEYSGRVRDAFIREGHDALSCDLLDTEQPGPHHKGDVREILGDGWDLMIGHPDCTYLCRAGQRWLNDEDDDRPGRLKGKPRWDAMQSAVDFFLELREAPIERIALENPRPNNHVTPAIGKPDQVIHPWQFGEMQTKATGLWLKNLPPLTPTEDVKAQMLALPKAERNRVHYMSPGPLRWKERSRTFEGIADAMAKQWGVL
jgi:hypothetical protein